MRNARILPVAYALLALAPWCAVRGQVADTTRALEGVIVTGRACAFDVASPVPARSLSGERLEQLSSLSVADAARYLSGVQLKDYGGIGGLKTVDTRGMGSAHVAVFLDGMPVSNVQNGQVDLGKFLLDNVEEIELYSAQRPTLFQPARGLFSSSVLLLRSKTPDPGEGRSSRVTAGVKGGSFGLFNPSLSWQQRLPRRTVLSANLNYLSADGKYKYRYTNGTYDTTLTRRNGDIRVTRAEAGLHAPLDEVTLLAVKGAFHASERGLPGAIRAGIFDNNQRQVDRSFFLQASLRREQETHRLMLNAKYNQDYNRYSDPGYQTGGGMVNTYRQEEWYASAAGTREIAPWCELGLAFDVAYNALSSGNYNFPYPSRLSLWGALSAMMRRERLTAQVNLLWLGVDERARSGLRPVDRRVFCPVASLSWQPFRGRALRARAFYKRSFRLPTFNDIYYAFPAAVSLRPEFTTQYDAGLAWERTRAGFLASVAVQGDFYYNRVRDKIIALPAGNIARWSMLNLGRATITGTEINARLEMAPGASTRLDVGLTYTWQRAIDDTPGDTYNCRLPYSPEHAGTVTAAARRGDWRLNYSFIYTGEHFSGRDNAPGDRERPWYTHDLSLGYRHAWRGMAFRLDAEVNNLLNQRYDVVRYYPMPGRSCRLNLSIII